MAVLLPLLTGAGATPAAALAAIMARTAGMDAAFFIGLLEVCCRLIDVPAGSRNPTNRPLPRSASAEWADTRTALPRLRESLFTSSVFLESPPFLKTESHLPRTNASAPSGVC